MAPARISRRRPISTVDLLQQRKSTLFHTKCADSRRRFAPALLPDAGHRYINERSLTHLIYLARPLSDEKRNAILTSAALSVAALGMGAPTAKIAWGAGVAEGTLFTYFPTKDALFNELYLALKQEVAATMMADYPTGSPLRDRWRHIWDRYIDWGAANSAKRKAIRQLTVSDRIGEPIKRSGGEAFRYV